MTAPSKPELWTAVTADGLPCGPADGDEAAALQVVKTMDENVPGFGPHRVQKYVTAERQQRTEDWYARRWERLDRLVREEASESFKERWFCVMANGTAEVTERPAFGQMLTERDAKILRLESEVTLLDETVISLDDKLRDATRVLQEMLTGDRAGGRAQVGEIMSALIGALQTEAGRTVIRYCGHLERLLKEARGAGS